jgi:hypothetical protein
MRSEQERQVVAFLAAGDLNASQIADITKIPRSTVREWLREPRPSGWPPRLPARRREAVLDLDLLPEREYSYLLGFYLGDGTVSRGRKGVYRLRIVTDARYPGIIGGCVAAVAGVVPTSRVSLTAKRGCVAVQSYSRQWPCLLPQHGPGPKHLRPFRLERWQRTITAAHPRELVRGLLHSDGSRFINPVVAKGRAYAYPRYMFANESADIRRIFCDHLDLLGIAWRRAGRRNISIARREAVAALDAFVGAKR